MISLYGALRSHSLDTPHSVEILWTRVVRPTQRPPLDKTQHSEQPNILASGGIRTRNPIKRAATDSSFCSRGPWNWQVLLLTKSQFRRYEWPRGLRYNSAGVRLLGLWVRIPPGTWMSLVRAVCCQVEVSYDGLITRIEESYWMSCVVVCDVETEWMGWPRPHGGYCCAKNQQECKRKGRFNSAYISRHSVQTDLLDAVSGLVLRVD